MRILFVDLEVRNPVRTSLALPMAFLYISTYVRFVTPKVHFFFHSLEIEKQEKSNRSLYFILSLYKPDIVMTSSITCNFNQACNVLKTSKQFGCLTVLGGIFPTANTSSILIQNSFIDVVIRGEGEVSTLELISLYMRDRSLKSYLIPGASIRQNGDIVHGPIRPMISLSGMPPLRYDILPISKYRRLATNHYIFSSRGCTNRCNFCTIAKHWSHQCRYFNLEKILNEVNYISTTFSPRRISFGDDTLFLDSHNLKSLLHELLVINLPVSFGCKTRIDIVTKENLKMLCDANFKEISFGIESNRIEQLSSLGKQATYHSQTKLKELIKISVDLGIRINLNFILGTPGETERSLNQKAKFIIDHCSNFNVIPLLSFLTPHPGTELYNNLNSFGIRIIDYNLDHYNHLMPVALPITLGINALQTITKTYNMISAETESVSFNPLLGYEYE